MHGYSCAVRGMPPLDPLDANRLFKLPSLETRCEDYGLVAVYKGGLEGHKHSYLLDDHHM